MTFKYLNQKTKAILITQLIGMLMGTSTHLVWFVKNGFLSENYNAPTLSKVFWDSLTFLDPLAALLLVIKPRTGVFLTLIIIITDVIHNNLFYMNELYINAPELSIWVVKYWMILGQIIFCAFVLFTFKGNLTEIKKASELNN